MELNFCKIVCLLFILCMCGFSGADSNVPQHATEDISAIDKIKQNLVKHPALDEDTNKSSVKRFPVVAFDFHHVATPYIISLWIVIVGLAKIG